MNKKRKESGALELVKKIDAYIMVVLEVDLNNNYIYVNLYL